jgi:hypothetical protein
MVDVWMALEELYDGKSEEKWAAGGVRVAIGFLEEEVGVDVLEVEAGVDISACITFFSGGGEPSTGWETASSSGQNER